MSAARVPRDEATLTAELRRLDKAIVEAAGGGSAAPLVAVARQRLSEAATAAETAAVDSGLPWSVPEWLCEDRHRWQKPGAAATEARAALVELDRLEAEGGPERHQSFSTVVLQAMSVNYQGLYALNWHARPPAALLAEREAVEQELAERRAGPGEPKPYRYVGGGSYSRRENGKLRKFRQGAVVMLDDWSAAGLGSRVVPVEAVPAQPDDELPMAATA